MMEEQDFFKNRFKKKKKISIDADEVTRMFGQTNQEAVKTNESKKYATRPQGVEPPEKIQINNLADLYELVNKFKPGVSGDNELKPIIFDSKGTNFQSDNFNGHITIPQNAGDSMVRQSLLEGFEMIRNHQQIHRAQNAAHAAPEDFGGYLPAKVPNPEEQVTWLDGFINRRLGGRREGLVIVWDLVEGKYQMDPWTCEVKPSNG